MIEQFLTPQEWAQAWSRERAPDEDELALRVFHELEPYAQALLSVQKFDGVFDHAQNARFVLIMTTLSVIECTLQRKFAASQGATQ